MSPFHFYQLLRTLVHCSFYPLPWLLIFSSCFSVYLSSCFPEGSKVGQPLVSLHQVFSIIVLFYREFELQLKSFKVCIFPVNCCELADGFFMERGRNFASLEVTSPSWDHESSCSGSIFINVYMVLFLFNNVIYVFFCYDYVFSLYVYVWLPWLRFLRAFSSVVRQMLG